MRKKTQVAIGVFAYLFLAPLIAVLALLCDAPYEDILTYEITMMVLSIIPLGGIYYFKRNQSPFLLFKSFFSSPL